MTLRVLHMEAPYRLSYTPTYLRVPPCSVSSLVKSVFLMSPVNPSSCQVMCFLFTFYLFIFLWYLCIFFGEMFIAYVFTGISIFDLQITLEGRFYVVY